MAKPDKTKEMYCTLRIQPTGTRKFPNEGDLVTVFRNSRNLFCILQTGQKYVLWKFSFDSAIWTELKVNLKLFCEPYDIGCNTNVMYVCERKQGSPHLFSECDLSNEDDLHFKEFYISNHRIESSYSGSCLFTQNCYYNITGIFKPESKYSITMYVNKLDLITKKWEISEHKTSRGIFYHTLSAIRNTIYIIGGCNSTSRHYPLFRILYYKIREKRWGTIRTEADPVHGFPPPRMEPIVFSAPDRNCLFMFGGRTYGGISINCAWMLDLSTGLWKKIPSISLFNTLFSHKSVVTPDGRMYTVGFEKDGDEILRPIQVHMTWLCKPNFHDSALMIGVLEKYFKKKFPTHSIKKID